MVARVEGERFHFLNTLHRHDGENELFYILDGELWLSSGDVEAVHGDGAGWSGPIG